MTTNKLFIVDMKDTRALLKASSLSDEEQEKRIKKILADRGIVEFTQEEMNTIPKNIKRLLIIQQNRCRLRTHTSGKNTTTYEIRLRRNGFDISASGKTIELAKLNFINKLKEAVDNKPTSSVSSVPTSFDSFATYYFEKFRSEKVSKATMITDMNRYKKHIQPYFKEMPLSKVSPSICKKLIDSIKQQGKGKTADEVYSLLNCIFKNALAHRLIESNPLDIVVHTLHEKESGTALTKAEEKALELGLKDSVYSGAIMLALCTGLRPNEMKSVKIDGDFVVAINSKRKTRKVEYKRIPIIDKLKPYIENLNIPVVQTMRDTLKRILPNHKLYDLRTTFYSRCIEYGVDEIAQKLFMGHSLGALGNAYTDMSDEYLKREGRKLNKWV